MKTTGWLFIFLMLTGGMAHAQYHLIWHDEFDGQGLPDPTRWNYEVGGHGWGNQELQYYTRERLKNARLENGRLVIEAHQENYRTAEYTSARLTTTHKGDWRYGRVEVRARLPAGRGTWPAIWMLPTEWIYGDGGWPDNGEIDIMEHVGYEPGIVHGSIHTDAYNHMDGTQKSGQINIPSATEVFHVYAIEWSPSAIQWYVDDQLYFAYENEGSGWQVWPFDHPFHLILNLAVGGTWGGTHGVDNTIFPVKMEVDYVRVYQTPEQLAPLIEGPGRVVPAQKGVPFSSKITDAQSYQWQVPNDATITTRADSTAVLVNWGCQPGQVSCRITTSDSVYEVSHAVALNDPQIEGPLFYSEGDDPLHFSVPEMTQTTYVWELPAEASFLSGEGTHAVEIDWFDQADSIKLILTNTCGEYELGHPLWKPGTQYPYPDPYQPHVLPDTIDPTLFDFGGEKVAYHDRTSANHGDGIRQDEGVDTGKKDQGHGSIGWINDGEWLEYSIRLEEAIHARVILRMASEESHPGSVDLLVNDEVIASGIQARNTGRWDNFEETGTGVIAFSPGDSILRLEFNQGHFNLGRIIVRQVETAIGPGNAEKHSVLYPNPAGDYLMVETGRETEKLDVYDLTGRLVHSETLASGKKTNRISLHTLPPGIYVVRIRFHDSATRAYKMIKK